MRDRRRTGDRARFCRRAGQARRIEDRHQHVHVGTGVGVRRAGQGRGRTADRRDEQGRRHRRRQGHPDLHRRGHRRRQAAVRVPAPRPGTGCPDDALRDLQRQLQHHRPGRGGPEGPQRHVGLRNREDPRGQALQVRGAHAGERDDRDGGLGAVPAEGAARLQDHRGGQPGLRVGPRLVGNLHQRAEGVQARCPRRGRDVPEIRRLRLLHGDLPAAGAASRRGAQHGLGRRPRHVRAPGRPARPLQAGRDVRHAAARELARAAGRRGARRHHRRRPWRSLLGASGDARRPEAQGLRREDARQDRRLPDLSDVPHGAGARRAEDRLRDGDQGERRQVAQPRAGRRRHAQDEVQGVWPRDHDA